MKFTINIECTPEEARQFLGLPDVAELQKDLMKDMQVRMLDNMQQMDAEQIMKFWFPGTSGNSMQNWQDMQKMMWDQMSAAMGQTSPKKDKK